MVIAHNRFNIIKNRGNLMKQLLIILLLCATNLYADETGLRVIRGTVKNWQKASGEGFVMGEASDYWSKVVFNTPFKDEPAIIVTPNFGDSITASASPIDSSHKKAFKTRLIYLCGKCNRQTGTYSFIAIGK